ncbi:hypothetical protein GSI_06280 [Ganoderma sinense ZZ0214-1]|uniref:Uncharacterized protein n=1 Tax=Ganoderma sinense ZZ0214-1 TaxID=1077348 RepID=A0A2G8SDA9_9APHY|nr:hypothetical protein GSI_06280 [Ganoderma sinense ZZ0214-1]
MSLAKSWFDNAFPSRARAEQLLRPDLESGLLSQHDFSLAVAFLPGYHRYLPYLHTALWGGIVGLALSRFKPRVRYPTTIVGVSALSGYGFGLFHYFRQHRKFAQQLDDRQAFLLVLENVNKRLGNQGSLFPKLEEQKMFETIMKRKQENGEVLSPDVEFFPDSDSTTDGVALSPAAYMQPPRVEDGSSARPKSTWEAIREANTQNAGRHSSWDQLRQRHERQRVSESGRVPVQQDTNSSSEIEDPRAKAQAEFDAILEAERKAARG